MRVVLALTSLTPSLYCASLLYLNLSVYLNTIHGLEMAAWNNYTIVSGLTRAVSVDYHFTQGYLYWTDQITDRITR